MICPSNRGSAKHIPLIDGCAYHDALFGAWSRQLKRLHHDMQQSTSFIFLDHDNPVNNFAVDDQIDWLYVFACLNFASEFVIISCHRKLMPLSRQEIPWYLQEFVIMSKKTKSWFKHRSSHVRNSTWELFSVSFQKYF